MINISTKILTDTLEEFNQRKQKALLLQNMIADYYEWAGQEKKAKRIKSCGSLLAFERYPELNDMRKLHSANFCKCNICPYCAWRKSLKRGAITERAINSLPKSAQDDLYLVTLTTTNRPTLSREYLSAYAQAATNFIREYFQTQNYAATMEITWSIKNQFHPHLHFLLWSKKANKLQTKSRMRYYWAEALRKSKCIPQNVFWQMADIRKANIESAKEISKYLTKVYANKTNKEELFDCISTLLSSTHGLRMWRTSGIFREAQKEAHRSLEKERQEEKEYLEHFESFIEFYTWFGEGYRISLEREEDR